jgi:hypothetical protein
MSQVVIFEFGKIEIHDTYVLAVMNEGVTVKPEYNIELIKIADKYFKGQPFAYITHRLNSYSVNPQIYFETSKIENLAAFAVVSKNKISTSNTEIEKIFLKKPFKHFTDLDNAIAWANEKIACFTAS